ncbi:serine/threonine kinase [Streptomyces spectabilis]|uniref:Serine/threonine kinase n=1 Tax=Streptomyces spectabilis TaxID=68270 RepID=A0A516RLG6_STRST|nr:serine/threonine kinase [Streptomyces spectabilis]
MRVPRFVGLMAMDAREKAVEHGVRLVAGDRCAFHDVILEYVVRQYPLADVEVPRGAVVTVWFDLGPGEGEGGAGVREPLLPEPSGGGLQQELTEPGQPEVGVGG